MTSRCGVATLMLSLPLALSAQSQAKPLAFSPVTSAVNATRDRGTPQTPICDGSEIRSARHRAIFGATLIGAALPVSLIGMYKTAHSPDHPEGPVVTGLTAAASMATIGFFVAASAHPGTSFWERAIGRMKTGETRTADVRTCFSKPVAMTRTDSVEEWTYVTSGPVTSRLKSVKLTFRDSVLVGIKRAEIDASLVGAPRTPLQPDPTQPPR